MGREARIFVAAAVAATALVAAPAQAGTVSVDAPRGTLVFVAAAGERNQVTIGASQSGLSVADSGAPTIAGPGCVQGQYGGAVCPSGGVRRFEVSLGDGDDIFSELPDAGLDEQVVDGGPGNDHIQVSGRGFAVAGGDGFDDFSLSTTSTTGASFSLDGEPNDGLAGDGGNVHADVEQLTGTPGPDAIAGSEADNRLSGMDGDDTIQGLGGSDDIRGNKGADTLTGGTGSDMIDALEVEGSGPPGADHVSCGAGYEYFKADADDTVDEDCEQGYDGTRFISRPAAPGDKWPVWFPRPPGARDPGDSAPAPALPPPSVKVLARGRVSTTKARIPLQCLSLAGCRGEVTLDAGKVRIGGARFKIGIGATRTITVTLKSAGRRLAKASRLRKVLVTARLEGGLKPLRSTVRLGSR